MQNYSEIEDGLELEPLPCPIISELLVLEEFCEDWIEEEAEEMIGEAELLFSELAIIEELCSDELVDWDEDREELELLIEVLDEELDEDDWEIAELEEVDAIWLLDDEIEDEDWFWFDEVSDEAWELATLEEFDEIWLPEEVQLPFVLSQLPLVILTQ